METTLRPCQDSPSPSGSSTPTPSGRAPPAKVLPALHVDTSAQPLESYRDDPSPSALAHAPVVAAPTPRTSTSASNPHLQHAEIQLFFTPYADDPRSENDEDVPLAQLYPYPTEAPPPYQVAVRESYRETLIRHIPSHSMSTVQDEEVAVHRAQADDVRFTVERVVAAIIVSVLLIVIASLLALVAVSGFNWKI